jgi:hypothetical protein
MALLNPEDSVIQIALTPISATLYCSYKRGPASEKLINSYTCNFEKERHSNLLSINAARKIKKAINWMAYMSDEKMVFVKSLNKGVKFRLSFITLTLPSSQIHPDTEIKERCLGPFLQWLRDRYKVKKYIWKAEIQKNGNIHFHITIDKFIHYQQIRKQWNKNVNLLGYVDRYTLETGKITPPSTEIKSVKNVKNMAGYLAAYMAPQDSSNRKDKNGQPIKRSKKEEDAYNNRVINGRLWGVSSYLSKIKSLTITEENIGFEEIIRYLKRNTKRPIEKDYVTIYPIYEDMFQEIAEVCVKFIGFDWLVKSGFDLDDVGDLTNKICLN